MLENQLPRPRLTRLRRLWPTQRPYSAGIAVLLIALILSLDSALMAQPLPEKLPWALRNHYTFRMATGSILYCEEDAAWTLNDKDGAPVVEEVSFSIALGDGRVLLPEHFERADATRENFEHENSAGTNYNVVFPPQDGLRVRHSFTSFKGRGFQIVTMSVENVSDAPIPVRKISPVVFLPNAMHLRDTDTELHQQHVRIRGGSPVYDHNSTSMLSLFEDQNREVLLALGVLPRGTAVSGIQFNAYGGTWSGEIASHYEPAYQLQPGGTLVADAVWVSFGDLNRDNIDLNYAWFFSTLDSAPVAAKAPHAWVSAPDSEDADSLLRAAEAWQAYGVRHALIPGNWERIPGALEGATPHYPRNMAQAARSFRDKGLTPGITLDPLASPAGDSPAIGRSEDGQAWLNLSLPEALPLYVERIETLLDWGFDFLVLEGSHIPDAVLLDFGLTRNQADHLAFTLAREIAGSKVVLPAASMTVQPANLDWNHASRVIQRMVDYAVVPGPVRLQSASLGSVNPQTVEAMRIWPGPVELLGAPERQHRDTYEALFAAR